MAKRKTTVKQEIDELKGIVATLAKTVQQIATSNTTTPDESPPEEQPQTPRTRAKRIAKRGTTGDVRRGRGKSKTQAVWQPLVIKDRPNLFDKMAERNQFKSDTKIDKKLWKGKQPSPRGGRVTLVEAECDECSGIFDVSPNEIKEVEEEDGSKRDSYVCNGCLRSRR